MPEGNNINFGELNINNSTESNDSNNFDKTENLIWAANDTDLKQENISTNNDTNNHIINLDNIQIKEEELKEVKKIKFGTDGSEKKAKKHYHMNYRKIFILSFSTIVVSSLISGWLYIYNDYIINYSTTNIWEETTISSGITKIKDMLNKYIYQDHNAYNDIDLNWEQWQINLNKVMNSATNYIQKKEILNNSVETLANTILSKHVTLDNTKKAITKNWFFSDEISTIIEDKQQIGSIQNSLLSLEAIKFSSAISVFSYLDTFIESLSKAIETSKSSIQENTQNIIQRWEKDINLYITNCYLNPFETNYECNVIWDFDKYYSITEDELFNTLFFKELMHYTDNKLEQTELPSFSITFQKFDQNKDEITFNIDINTFKQDEIELAKKWILSPHIFIFNSLINNLKQSKFIVGESISTKSLKIETEIISIWSTQFVVHNSNKTFTLPIQKEGEREIFDFVDTKNTN